MGTIFSGLEEFGIEQADEINVFNKVEETESATTPTKQLKTKKTTMLYVRNMACPVCGKNVAVQTVKKNVAKLDHIDDLLRPVYKNIDPLCYDVILCEHCGYTALDRNFKKIDDRQIKKVRTVISEKFKQQQYPEIYNYEIALKRYKLALFTDVLVGRTELERAFTSLKALWIVKALIEQCGSGEAMNTYKELFKELSVTAYEGFSRSYSAARFPVFGMGIDTYHYLLGALAYHGDMREASMKWLSKTVVSMSSNDRLKEKARELRDQMSQKAEEVG